MPLETRKFTKSGIAHIQALFERHNRDMGQALNNIADDLGLDPKAGWQPDVESGHFVRDMPAAPPAPSRGPVTQTPAPPAPARDIPMPPPVPPVDPIDNNGGQTDGNQ